MAYAWVEIQRRSACAACQPARLRHGDVGEALERPPSGSEPSRTLPLRPGDEVIVGLADGVLLRGALLAYLLPLFLLLAGALLGQAAFG
jgi:sigma-E factor negative regulatory protein RseC